MTDDTEPLSTTDHWSERWRKRSIESVQVDPRRPPLRDLDRFLRRHLPQDATLRLLEVGCYPGKFMWYFAHRFGYRVSGLENVGWCCRHARELLAVGGVDAEVIEADLLRFETDRRWDVVASFGLVEHFTDLDHVVARHVALVAPGGRLVLTAPNHTGLYGRILARVAPDKHATHTLLAYEELRASVARNSELELVAGGHLGRLGFWNSGLYAYLAAHRPRIFPLVRVLLRGIERAGQWLLPNSALLSPNFAVVAQRVDRR